MISLYGHRRFGRRRREMTEVKVTDEVPVVRRDPMGTDVLID